jgi:Uma2 family endonuclease
MTIAQRTRPTMTLDEFLALPEEKPALEYQDGVITQKMAPNWDHGTLQVLIPERINIYARPRRLAFAFAELRTTDRAANASLVPDVSVYVWDRIERDREARRRGAFTPPDIAIEIASPGQGRRRLIERCRGFVERGSRAAVLVDPQREDIVEVRPGGVQRRLRGSDVLDLDDVIPGLAIVVGELFAALTFD